jgi:hypothetical protein
MLQTYVSWVCKGEAWYARAAAAAAAAHLLVGEHGVNHAQDYCLVDALAREEQGAAVKGAATSYKDIATQPCCMVVSWKHAAATMQAKHMLHCPCAWFPLKGIMLAAVGVGACSFMTAAGRTFVNLNRMPACSSNSNHFQWSRFSQQAPACTACINSTQVLQACRPVGVCNSSAGCITAKNTLVTGSSSSSSGGIVTHFCMPVAPPSSSAAAGLQPVHTNSSSRHTCGHPHHLLSLSARLPYFIKR